MKPVSIYMNLQSISSRQLLAISNARSLFEVRKLASYFRLELTSITTIQQGTLHNFIQRRNQFLSHPSIRKTQSFEYIIITRAAHIRTRLRVRGFVQES